MVTPIQVPQVPTIQYPVGGNIIGNPNFVSPQLQGQQQSGGSNVLSNLPVGKIGSNLLGGSGQVYTGALENALPWQAAGSPVSPTVASSMPKGMTTSAGSGLANAGAGLVGGLAANAVFGGGTGTNVGSAVGTGAAMLAGLGPVGIGIGAFLGGGLGSLFGKKKPSNKLQVGGINMATGQYDPEGSKLFSQSGNKFSEKNAAIRDAYSMASADMVKFLRDSGAQQKEEVGNLVIRAGDRSGYDYFFEKPTKSTETVDFRGSQRNKELMNMSDSERNIQSFGKDINKFGEGLQAGILSKFNLTPEQEAQARAMFNAKVSSITNPQGSAAQGMPIPMIAPKTTFDEFMQQQKKSK